SGAARRALQAAAVLGDRAACEGVGELVGDECRAALETSSGGLASIDGGSVVFHPLVRELVDASIPVEVRRELNDRALAWHIRVGSPLEVRSVHASAGSDAFTALLLLEQCGAAAMGRGDPQTAAVLFRSGLERARAELGASGD